MAKTRKATTRRPTAPAATASQSDGLNRRQLKVQSRDDRAVLRAQRAEEQEAARQGRNNNNQNAGNQNPKGNQNPGVAPSPLGVFGDLPLELRRMVYLAIEGDISNFRYASNAIQRDFFEDATDGAFNTRWFGLNIRTFIEDYVYYRVLSDGYAFTIQDNVWPGWPPLPVKDHGIRPPIDTVFTKKIRYIYLKDYCLAHDNVLNGLLCLRTAFPEVRKVACCCQVLRMGWTPQRYDMACFDPNGTAPEVNVRNQAILSIPYITGPLRLFWEYNFTKDEITWRLKVGPTSAVTRLSQRLQRLHDKIQVKIPTMFGGAIPEQTQFKRRLQEQLADAFVMDAWDTNQALQDDGALCDHWPVAEDYFAKFRRGHNKSIGVHMDERDRKENCTRLYELAGVMNQPAPSDGRQRFRYIGEYANSRVAQHNAQEVRRDRKKNTRWLDLAWDSFRAWTPEPWTVQLGLLP